MEKTVELLEKQLSETKENFTTVQDEAKQAKEKAEALEKEAQELREFKAKAEEEKKQLEIQKLEAERKASVQKFVSDLKTEKLCSLSMEPLVEALVGEEKKEYSITGQDKKETKYESKQSLLKECLKLFKAAAEVNFEESSTDGKKDADKLTDDQIAEKAEAISKEKGISYKMALRQVRAEIKSA
jgi:hypothetical protein